MTLPPNRNASRRRKPVVILTHNGITLSIHEWSQAIGRPVRTIHSRMKRGWEMSKVLSPITLSTRKRALIEYEGKVLTVSEMSAMTGLSKSLIHVRLSRGWSGLDIVTCPSTHKNQRYAGRYNA